MPHSFVLWLFHILCAYKQDLPLGTCTERGVPWQSCTQSEWAWAQRALSLPWFVGPHSTWGGSQHRRRDWGRETASGASLLREGLGRGWKGIIKETQTVGWKRRDSSYTLFNKKEDCLNPDLVLRTPKTKELHSLSSNTPSSRECSDCANWLTSIVHGLLVPRLGGLPVLPNQIHDSEKTSSEPRLCVYVRSRSLVSPHARVV